MISSDRDFLALQADLAGQYSIERELGRGGMGVVYLAREVLLDRPVAIKVLPPVMAARPELRDRFMREARTSAQLSHPNIVPIFGVDEVGSFVFLVMAFVEGETLGQRIRSRGPLPAGELARVMREVAWALAYAHARGIVHRDVKPDNILIETGSGRALVTDFGIAHVTTGATLTEAGQVMGTAQYMSPEQAAGEPLDGRSDLYSLGVVAFLALTGRLPFDAPTVPAILAMHLTREPPPASSIATSAPRSMTALIDRCLAKQPADRYATGEALADAISVASERPAEIPPALRVWLTRADDLKPVYFFWTLFAILPALFNPSFWTPVIVFAPALLHLVLRLHQTRRVLAGGYTVDDLRVGLKSFVEREREERAYEFGREPPLLARALRWLTYAALLGVAALALTMRFAPETLPPLKPVYWLQVGALISFAGGAIGLVYPGRQLGVTDRITDLQARFWNGRFGRWFVETAGFRLGTRAVASHAFRPTEVALGLATDRLFESLSRSAQRELAELPAIVRRLEAEAQETRKRIAALDASAAAIDGDRAPRPSAALAAYGSAADGSTLAAQRRDVAAELRAARAVTGRQLSVTVAALESIRLDLLRLQAGPPSADAITAVLDAARRVGDEIAAVVQARADVNAYLATPPVASAAAAPAAPR